MAYINTSASSSRIRLSDKINILNIIHNFRPHNYRIEKGGLLPPRLMYTKYVLFLILLKKKILTMDVYMIRIENVKRKWYYFSTNPCLSLNCIGPFWWILENNFIGNDINNLVFGEYYLLYTPTVVWVNTTLLYALIF